MREGEVIIWWNMACHRSGISLVHTFLLDVTPDIMAGYDMAQYKKTGKQDVNRSRCPSGISLVQGQRSANTNKMTGAASSFIRSLKKEKTVLRRKEKKIKKFSVWKLQNMGWKNKNQFVIPNTSSKYQFFFESLSSLFDALQVPQHW